jgi:hypothetical protein
MNITSPDQIPHLIAELRTNRFYGELKLTFRAGHIARIVTETSQVFDDQREGTRHNGNQR